ncbi:MAG: diguanylate cyclase [Desulfobacteraceae bacterium]|nr:MAG: diguanylate cyclase [Desulfobacteraceae bacterium]
MMKEKSRTKQELLEENAFLKKKIRELKHAESECKRAEEAMQDSEDRFRQIFDNMADGVAICQAIDDGSDFIFVDINRKGQLSSSMGRSYSVGKRLTEVFPFVERNGLLDVFRQVWRTGEAQQHPLKAYEDRQVKQWVENYVFKLPSGLIVLIFSDTTEKHRVEEALRESEEKYRLMVENAAEVILIAQDGLLKYVNPVAVKILGYSEEMLTSMPFVELLHPEDIKKVFEAHMKIMRGEENQPIQQFRVVPSDGTVRWVDSRAVVVSWKGKPATVNFITDITERKSMEEKILSLSITDQLTGLHNRRGFLTLAQQQLKLSERNKKGVLLYFADLDLLKRINDTLGHEEGDKALIEAAKIFKETFRTSDIIARLGGDEYAVLTVDITEANSEIFTARLQTLIDIRNNQKNRRYKLSISVGSSYFNPESPCSLDELMARADKSMYEQKQNKKGLVLQSASFSSSNS